MPMSYVLRHVKIVTPLHIVDDGYIVIENGFIKEIGKEPISLSKLVDSIDTRGLIAVPGFIDTHIHGYGGIDIMWADAHSILDMGKKLVKHGVTAFLPSTVTASHEGLVDVCRKIRDAYREWNPDYGARILGIHLEGPYISPIKRGAQNPKFIRRPSASELNEYIEVSEGLVRQITIAPEVENGIEFISYAYSRGIVVSIGHTVASYEEGLRAIEAGARKATHIFNAMTEFHHRKPGVAIALLQNPKVFIEVIADFIHLHPAVVKMVIDIAKPERVALITDAISATALPDGEYELGGLRVVVKNGIPRLADSGALAGSTLTMDRAFKNVLSLGYTLQEVSMMTSYTPAKSIKALEKEKIGMIEQCYRADIVLLDSNLDIVKTIVNGEIAYEKK